MFHANGNIAMLRTLFSFANTKKVSLVIQLTVCSSPGRSSEFVLSEREKGHRTGIDWDEHGKANVSDGSDQGILTEHVRR